MRIFATLVILVVSVSAFAADTNPTRTCETNFVTEGSFFSGKSYKTWQEFSDVTYDAAFRKTAQAAASAGLGTVTPNKDAGIITASQSVTAGKGATAPLNIIVDDKAGGTIRVVATFNTGPGQAASTDSVKGALCKLVEAAGQ